MSEARHIAIAEREIKEILTRLEDRTDRDVDMVRIEIPRPGVGLGFSVEIFLKRRPGEDLVDRVPDDDR